MFMDFVKDYGIWLAVALAAAGLGWFLKKTATGKKLVEQLKEYTGTAEFRESVHQVMAHAEKLITGTEKGHERLLYVCGWINKQLPAALQPAVTAEFLAEIVEDLFKQYAEKTAGGHTVVK